MQYRIKLIWTPKKRRTGRARSLKGLAQVYEEESVKGHFQTLWLDAPRVLALLAVLAVAGWFGGAGGLLYWLGRNPFNRVGYADLVCPWRWERIHDLRGQGYIAAGLDALAQKQINEAFFNIRQGLSRHPNDPDARLAFGRVYAGSGYYPGLRDMMKPQLAFGPAPEKFSRLLIDVAAKNDDQGTVIQACDNALTVKNLTADERGELLEEKAKALLALKKYPEALAVLELAGQGRSMDWRRLHVSTLIGAGRAKEALAEVQGWPRGSVPPELRQQLIAQAARGAGQFEMMTAALEELKRQHPSQPEPRLEAIGSYLRAGRSAEARSELEEFFRRFDANPQMVLRAEQVCTSASSVELVQLCLDNAQSYGRPLGASLFDLALTQLRKGDIENAEQTYIMLLAEERKESDRPAESLLDATGQMAQRSRLRSGSLRGTVSGTTNTRKVPTVMSDYLRTLLDAVAQPPGDRAEAHCSVLLKSRLTLQAYTGSADVLAKVGHWPAVAAVARAGLTRFPDSAQLTDRADTAAQKIASAPPVETPLLKRPASTPTITFERKVTTPPVPVVESIYATMAMDEFFTKLDAAMKRQAWTEADEMISGLNATSRTLPTATETELGWTAVRIAYEQDDKPGLIYQVSQRIRTHKNEVPRALEYARRYRDKGDSETARTIAGKILQEVPGYVAGRDFLAELNKPAPEATAPAPKAKPGGP